jgi:hypothetical protein
MHRWLFAFSLVASVAGAQTGTGTTSAAATPGTIDPGMSKAQVIERLGKPATVRDYQGTTYLLYPNACGKTCGMQDLVILDHDVVVDAVFRSPNRHYTGTSSSPDATKPNARSARNQPLAVPAAQEAQPTAAERVTPGHSRAPADSAKTSTSTAPRDSSRTPTSMPPRDSARTPTSYPPADSAPPRQGPAPYGKPSPTPPPADSASSSTSHPPADNSTSATSHPPKPPK